MSAFVQFKSKEGAGTTLSWVFGDSIVVSANDKLYLWVAVPRATDTSTSVATNNSGSARTSAWTKQKSINGADTTAGSLSLWSCTVTTGGALALDVTVSAGGISMGMLEFSSAGVTVDTTGSYTQASGANTNLAASNSSSTSNANDVWLTGFSTNDTPGTFAAMNISAPNDNWQLAGQTSGATSGMPFAAAYKIVSSTITSQLVGGVTTTNSVNHYTGGFVAVAQVDAVVKSNSILIGGP